MSLTDRQCQIIAQSQWIANGLIHFNTSIGEWYWHNSQGQCTLRSGQHPPNSFAAVTCVLSLHVSRKATFPRKIWGNSNMHHPFILKGWSQPLWKKSLIASASKSIWQGLMPGIMPYKGVHRVPWYHPRRTPHRYPLWGSGSCLATYRGCHTLDMVTQKKTSEQRQSMAPKNTKSAHLAVYFVHLMIYVHISYIMQVLYIYTYIYIPIL